MSKIEPGSDSRRFAAFISYSHADERFAARLHKRLERFVIPSSFNGRTKSQRFRPVYRDQEEFAPSVDLGAMIRGALHCSDSLIVVSSASSARSRWVNEEIRAFLSLRSGCAIISIDIESESNRPLALKESPGCIVLSARRSPWTGRRILAGSKIAETVAHSLGHEPRPFRAAQVAEARARWFTRVVRASVLIIVVAGGTSLSLGDILFSSFFASFAQGQDSYVLGQGCNQLEPSFDAADILTQTDGEAWDQASLEARSALTKLYDACKSVGAQPHSEPVWLLRIER